MIKNIIFDIGNVLVYFRPLEYLGKRYSPDDAAYLMSAVFNSPEWVGLDKGEISEKQALETFIGRDPERELLLRNLMGSLHNMFTPIEENVAIAGELRRKGHKLLYLSNISHEILAYIRTNYNILEQFDGGTASAEVKLLKPGRGIYEHLLHAYTIDPAESLFIDDTERNIMAADALGFNTVHLTDPGELKEKLAQFEV